MEQIAYILAVALGIGFLIFIHELGHYLAARSIGARVEVFSLGFGPRLVGFRRGVTDYRIALIPLGGYVQVTGQDPLFDGRGDSAALVNKTVMQRMWFFSAGVLMNLLFAFITFPLIFQNGVEFLAPEVGSVQAGGGAWHAGVLPGDRILEMDGKEVYAFENLTVETALAGKKPVMWRVQRGDQIIETSVLAQYDTQQGILSAGVTPATAIEPGSIQVEPGSPAATAGIIDGDLLVAINGEGATGENAVPRLRQAAQSDGPVQVEILRDGKPMRIEVKPGPMPAKEPRIGVILVPVTLAGLRGAAIDVAQKTGLLVGDVLRKVDSKPYLGNLDTVLPPAGNPAILTVVRGNNQLTLTAVLDENARQALINDTAWKTDVSQIIVDPVEGEPAQAAGILAGDVIVSAAGSPVEDFDDLRGYVHDADGQSIPLVVRGIDGEERSVSITPHQAMVQDTGIAVSLSRKRQLYQRKEFSSALQAGFVCSLDLIKQLYVTLKRLFTGDVAAKNLGGIITISRVSYRFAQYGPARFLYFLALLSINLAFINILPIPVLDGGHLLFLAIEKVKGSPISPRILTYSQIMGLIFVLALLVFVTYNDILRLL